jgi:hypothetical protein
LDRSAQKEFVNWTGGHPVQIALLLSQVRSLRIREASKSDVDQAAEQILERGSGKLEALWLECPEDTRNDIVVMIGADIPVAELPGERARYMTARGLAVESGNRLRLACRFLSRLAESRRQDVSGVRRLFEKEEDFNSNIRTVLELRVAQVRAGDGELIKFIQRAVRHLPDEPEAALSTARDILDRALDLVWAVEAPGLKIPDAWLAHWKAAEITLGRSLPATRESVVPEERGRQCALLRLASGQQRIRPITTRVSKATCVLIDHMSHMGDLKNHHRGPTTLMMGVAFCASAIELTESLARELVVTQE